MKLPPVIRSGLVTVQAEETNLAIIQVECLALGITIVIIQVQYLASVHFTYFGEGIHTVKISHTMDFLHV